MPIKCLANEYPELVKEWHPEKNEGLTPYDVTSGSGKRVWWLVSYDDPKTGKHFDFEWQAIIKNRVSGQGCPYLSGKAVWVGFNDLATTNSDLVKEWDYNKNNDITPQLITNGSNKKAWWRCLQGHSYEAYIPHRVNGSGCPYCAGKKVIDGVNDLASQYPEIASEWNTNRNGNITPADVTKASAKKVWWLGKCGHEWEAAISNRTRQGNGCPYCSNQKLLKGFNDLATTDYELSKEWHPTKNGDCTPSDVICAGEKKIWWLGKCGHEWEAKISQRKNGSNCPYCAHIKLLPGFNDFETLYPECINNWDYERNKKKPSDYLGAGKEKVWWVCNKCGKQWQASLDSQARGHGCPDCAIEKLVEKNNITNIVKRGSLATRYPELVHFWDHKLNGNKSPDRVVPGSSAKVWWTTKCGHSWKRAINSFVENQTCPVCANKQLLMGFNDLKTLYPEIAKEWNYERNNSLPEEYLSGARDSVWWKCSECGLEWKASIGGRVSTGSKCKACSSLEGGKKNRENALKQTGSVELLYPDLLEEWDYSKNSILPSELTPYTDTKIWWLCNKCGRSWRTGIRNRTRMKSGCPSCASTGTSFPEQAIFYYVLKYYPDACNRYKDFGDKGITELDIWIPSINIAIEYDGEYYHSNKDLADKEKDDKCIEVGIELIRIKENTKAKEVVVGEKQIEYSYLGVSNLGQIDFMIYKLLTKFLSVDVKSSDISVERDQNYILENIRRYEKANSFAVKCPDLVNEWHPYKNGKLKPENFSVRNGAKIWWLCSKCGYEWKTTIASRSSGAGCNKCSSKKGGRGRVKTLIDKNGSLKDTNPELVEQWHPTKNGNKLPSDYTQRSGDKVWWKCPTCNGEWEAVIASRSGGVGCPYCANNKILPGFNDFESKAPNLAKDWDYEKNRLRPDEVSRNSKQKVFWKCAECGYEWMQAIVYNNYGCPHCNKRPSANIKRDQVLNWREQHPNGSEQDCVQATGISMSTVKKWWDDNSE